MQGLIGYVGILALAWGLSENRRTMARRTVAAGLGLHLALALTLFFLPFMREAFLALNAVVQVLARATEAGTGFVFGYLGGAEAPFLARPGTSSYVLAFRALPMVMVISALSAVLYHWRVLPVLVNGFAWCLERLMGLGGAAGVATAANVFVGMVEAPLLVKPYLARASRADLFVVMTAGMATIAGTVMVLYAGFLAEAVPGALGHLLTASVLNAPAAIVIARLLVPPQAHDEDAPAELSGLYGSTMEAVTRGTTDGLKLLLNIAAMLVVLVALVALVNAVLGLGPEFGGAPLSLERLLGWLMAPVAFAIGIPWAEAGAAGQLIGVKVVLNELLAYLAMGRLPAETLSESSRLIMTYALCGFANFGSLGIMLGGLGAMLPERRAEVVALGLKSIAAGLMTTLLTAALIGVLTRLAG